MKTYHYFGSVMLLSIGFFGASATAADLKAGEQKASVCTGCHGPKGVSTDSQFPRLAGQQAAYLVNQLKAFKQGSRENSIMKNMAQGLSDDDMANLAAYFAAQAPKSAGGDPDLAKAGEAKSAMCLGCHGAGAKGNGQFPRLAGQHPDYIAKQLTGFKDGTRKGSPMSAVAANLSKDDIKALAAYFGSL